MFELASDLGSRLWLALIGSPNSTESDYQSVCDVLDRVSHASTPIGDPSIFVLVTLPHSGRPPAVWRQRFAEAERRGHGKRVAFAVVSDSAALRGIRTAVNWISPPPKGYETTAVSTFDEAMAWMEQQRPGVGSTLRTLMSEASGRARVHRPRGPSARADSD